MTGTPAVEVPDDGGRAGLLTVSSVGSGQC